MPTASSVPEATPKHLSFMQKLDPLVSLYRPSGVSSTGTGQEPRLVIVASWTDARDAHIAKYVSKYQAMYPTAQILLLKSTMKCIVTPSHIGPAMKIAASVLRDAFQTLPLSPSPSLLVHIFSNGGSSSVTNLYEQYAATAGPDDDKRLPSHVSIFDSSPSLFHIPHAVAFVSVGLSSPFQRLIAAPFLYAYAVFWTAFSYLGFIHNSLEDWYKSHNNHPANSTELRRVYIYSPTDTIVAYRDVELHAKAAKAKGFSVALEKYEGSAHVAHVRKDESRYWGIVKKTWEG